MRTQFQQYQERRDITDSKSQLYFWSATFVYIYSSSVYQQINKKNSFMSDISMSEVISLMIT